jgi:urease alpha subunit
MDKTLRAFVGETSARRQAPGPMSPAGPNGCSGRRMRLKIHEDWGAYRNHRPTLRLAGGTTWPLCLHTDGLRTGRAVENDPPSAGGPSTPRGGQPSGKNHVPDLIGIVAARRHCAPTPTLPYLAGPPRHLAAVLLVHGGSADVPEDVAPPGSGSAATITEGPLLKLAPPSIVNSDSQGMDGSARHPQDPQQFPPA